MVHIRYLNWRVWGIDLSPRSIVHQVERLNDSSNWFRVVSFLPFTLRYIVGWWMQMQMHILTNAIMPWCYTYVHICTYECHEISLNSFTSHPLCLSSFPPYRFFIWRYISMWSLHWKLAKFSTYTCVNITITSSVNLIVRRTRLST